MEHSKTTVVQVKPKECVTFRCCRCAHCCRHIEGCVMVESLDAYRMAKFLRAQGAPVDCMDDLLYGYCTAEPISDGGYPIFTLKTAGTDGTCVFLQDGRCSIYEARPRTCRLYPFSIGPGERGRDFEYCLSFDDNQANHFRDGNVFVKDWLYHNFFKDEKEFLKQEFQYIPMLGKLFHSVPVELRPAAVFKLLFYHYSNFDLDEAFLPQYERNNQALLRELSQLADGNEALL